MYDRNVISCYYYFRMMTWIFHTFVLYGALATIVVVAVFDEATTANDYMWFLVAAVVITFL